jgi:hypothetical protein
MAAPVDTVSPRNRSCPKCAAPSVTLPVFTARRRSPVTCTNCGARLERVLPGVPYYTLALVVGIAAQIAVLPLLWFAFVGSWGWFAMTLSGLVAINLGVSAFLNSRTRVEFAEPADARKDQPGRWYPD